MKIIKPSYEIMSKINGSEMLRAIEIAGRTCYKSEDKITEDSAKKFVKKLLSTKPKHESVLEHEKITVKFIFDRGVSHEIVRHRVASYSQESTRYCNYSKDRFDNQLTFILPCWFPDIVLGEWNNTQTFPVAFITEQMRLWMVHMLFCEEHYKLLINNGWQPQQARSILPNSLKTEIVVTANLREWRLIFNQRTAQAAHLQMREVMIPLLAELKEKVPVIFDDILKV